MPASLNNYMPSGRATYGRGMIVGTVKKHVDPSDVPVARKVVAVDEAGFLLFGDTFSAGDGSYRFERVRLDRRYTVIAYDYEHKYRAVIADNLQPEPMP